MRVVCAPDSFKESMSAPEAAAAMARGVRRVLPDADCLEIPMADGGEGTAETLTGALGGRLLTVPARDALGRPGKGAIGVVGDDTAVLDIASAVGLMGILAAERDPLASSSLGVADLVRAALDEGARHLVIGLGGSATNDGGAGLLVGLGAVLRDAHGEVVPPVPRKLDRVATVDLSGLDPRLGKTAIDVACDVTNPLLGPTGASAVFGPQKGATPRQVRELDTALAAWAAALEPAVGFRVRSLPGAGAAGGLGAGLLALGATLRRGVDVVIETVGLDSVVVRSDLVLTGEGSIDAQTRSGKTPAGVAMVARRHGVPVVALAGRVPQEADDLSGSEFTAIVPILHEVVPLETAVKEGASNLERATATVMRLVTANLSG